MRFSLSLLFLSLFFFCEAQEEIFLENPSFEDVPKLSHTPKGWYDCGFPGESQADTHPVPDSDFQVYKPAIDGATYLGLTTRENETWEAVGQRLSQTLKAGKAYSFSIHLARSSTYLSPINKLGSKKSNSEKTKKVNFATPIKLRIWGGNSYCAKTELLAESSLIINTRWLSFNFQFEPKTDANYITFEVFYQTPCPYPYNGNILLDNASSIAEVVNGFVRGLPAPRKDTISNFVDLETIISKSEISTPVVPIVQKTDSSTAVNKVSDKYVSKEKQSTIIKEKQEEPVLRQRKFEKKTYKSGENKFSTPIIDFYKENINLVEFQDNSSELDDLSIQALSLMAERLISFDKDLKIIIQAKAPNSSLQKARQNTLKSVLSKVKLKENQYTFGFETNTPVLINESNSSVRIKLCLR